MKPTSSVSKVAVHFALCAVASACSFVALAQSTPGISDALRQVPLEPPLTRPTPTLPALSGGAIEPPMQTLPQGGASVLVKTFQIIGNREIDTNTLLAEIAGESGKTLSLPQLETVATQLTRFYRRKGYFVARVYIPQQEVTDGVVVLRAVEGNYGKFVLDNKSLVRDDIVQSMLDDVKRYDVVSLDTLERAMLIINDTPGSNVARADVMPGEKVGTSDFAVGTVATPEHEGYVLVDNHGTKATGRERISGNWDWISPTRRGDKLSVSGLAALNGDLINGRVGYGVNLTPSGMRGEAALSRTQYSLGGAFDALEASGYANSLELGVTYPLRRIRSQTIEIGLSYAHKDLRDEIKSTSTSIPKASDELSAKISVRDEGRLLGFDGVTQLNLNLTSGQLDIRDDVARANDQAQGGAHTQGGFNLMSISLGRVNLLPNQFTLSTTLKVQQSFGKNLDGSERMGIAGAGGVMAYPSGEISGGDALLARVELSRALPEFSGMQHQWSVLFNWGQAQETSLQPTRSLSDVSLGYVAKHSRGWLFKAYLAHRLESTAAISESTPSNKIWVQAGYIF